MFMEMINLKFKVSQDVQKECSLCFECMLHVIKIEAVDGEGTG